MKKVIFAINAFLVILACFLLQSNKEPTIQKEIPLPQAVVCGQQDYLSQEDSIEMASEENTYLKSYFSRLNDNMGKNSVGSCSFVAMGMLLSYYDSFLDDNIIPEQYDVASQGEDSDIVSRNSPGILNDDTGIVINTNGIEEDKIYDYLIDKYRDYLVEMYNMEDTSLHAKLITIGYRNNFLDFNNVMDSSPYAIVTEEIEVILKEYLDDVVKMQEHEYNIQRANNLGYKGDLQVRNYIKDKINDGNPVLVWASNRKQWEAHAFICYDYDSDTDTFYGNMGWVNSGKTHYNFASDYPTFVDAIVLTFPEKEHVHSYNYEVQHGDHVDRYCYCDEFIRTDESTILNKPCRRGCEILGGYTIPAWATDIKEGIFKNNSQLEYLYFENNSKLSFIPAHSFENCKNLRSITFSNGVEFIGEFAFASCAFLNHIDFNNSAIKEVWGSAFNGCSGLRYSKYTGFNVNLNANTFYFPPSMTYIGEHAFSGCKNIREINVKGNLNQVKFAAFWECTSLKQVTFSSKVNVIDIYAFDGCSSLQNVNFSSDCGLYKINDYAFRNTGLAHFEIPDGVTELGEGVFYGCEDLTSVLLPSSVTYIGYMALSGGDETSSGQVTIYAERNAPFVGWLNQWNGDRPVFFGCTLSEDKTYVETINTALLYNKNAVNGIKPPWRKQYKFDGWYANSDFTGTKYGVDSVISASPGVLYTKWNLDIFQGLI